HAQHLKILFDYSPNHIATTHPWAAKPPTTDWFHGTVQHHLNAPAPATMFYTQADNSPRAAETRDDAIEAITDPHSSPQLSKALAEGWTAGVFPDLNTENPLVAQYLT